MAWLSFSLCAAFCTFVFEVSTRLVIPCVASAKRGGQCEEQGGVGCFGESDGGQGGMLLVHQILSTMSWQEEALGVHTEPGFF